MVDEQISFKLPWVSARDVLSRRFCIFLWLILSRKLTARKNYWIIPGITSSAGVGSINHALFADDTLLLGGASLKMARSFSEIMHHFCIISGALINSHESAMYVWNVDQSIAANIS